VSKKSGTWSREELEAVATCLRADLETAGPQFALEFTTLSPMARQIASTPPIEGPPDILGPGSGGFVEVEDMNDPPPAFKRMLGYMHGALGEPSDTAIALRVDGSVSMALEFWSGLDHLEHLEGLVDQVQGEVMESTHERWPMCPAHDHELSARVRDDWLTWQCPDTGEAIARLGELAGRLA
jgi:hypothetical protein